MAIDKRIRKIARDIRDKRRRFIRDFTQIVRKAHQDSIACDSCTTAHCCCQLVFVALFEGVIIADHLLRTYKEDLYEKAARQGAEQVALLTKTTVLDPEAHAPISADWLDRREPCAFLVDGRCAIYQHRPLACSSYWVVDDPEQCAPPSGKDVCIVNNSKALSFGLTADEAFVGAVFGSSGRRHIVAQGPLGHVVRLGAYLLVKGPGALKAEELKIDTDAD